ncbi:MAG TPA: protein kinase [Gemmatimonadales bacterium]|nr:protein kinase [Gemmatimonadales bacterium]
MADLLSSLRQAVADRYTVDRELGRGGMATVFLAEDRKHSRKVALKVLHPDLAALIGPDRFLREIETAARLSHPHILPLHDSGEAGGFLYYVMPYVEGETLRGRLDREGRLPVEEAVRLAREIAGALDYAHRNGVIHRDIKPENVLLHDGHAVVADFGIARAVGAAGDSSITRTGVALGTPLYMSPEQAGGERPVDHRADIYALGSVLFEMLAGRPPFTGTSAERLLVRRVTEEAPSLAPIRPDLPGGVVDAVRRALRKDPDERFATAAELAAALTRGRPSWALAAHRSRPRWVVAGLAAASLLALGLVWWRVADERVPAPRIEALAVLPLDDLQPAPGQEYFAEGMTEALIAHLAQIRALKVISRTSVMRYRDTEKPLPEIARELGVDAVLEGSVLRHGSRVRITVQLIDAATDRHLWADSYEKDLTDVLALQMEVARAVTEEIRVVVSPAERLRLAESRAVKPMAYEAYLRGRYHWNKRTPDEFRAAIRDFERAIEIDPTYALPYSGLADCHILLVEWRQVPASEGVPRARAAALKALELDSLLAEAHTSLAEVRVIEWDWAGAEREFRRALDLNPGYATAHQWYGFFLSKMGRHPEAIAQLERAQELDPLSLIIKTEFSRVYYHARRFEDGIRSAERAMELDSTFTDAYYVRAINRAELPGGREAALADLRRVGTILPTIFDLGRILAQFGRTREARAIADSLAASYLAGSPNPRFGGLAEVYAALGETDRGFEWLERAYASGVDDQLTYLKVLPALDPLRDDPRFGDLLRRMRLAE